MILTLLFALGALGLGLRLFWPLLRSYDVALRLGLAGLLGLGIIGFITLPIGLVPGGLSWGLWVVLLASGVGLFGLVPDRDTCRFQTPKAPSLVIPGALALLALMAAIGVQVPSDMNDWDTLAYHLAVPKIWLQHGRIDFIPFIHHSNFPFAVDNLYLWGLQWGGESGAKAFQLAFYLLGMLCVFGLARQRYGEKAAWWSTLAYASIPAAMWEAGSGYIDVAHGLYAAFGVLLLAEWFSPGSGEGDSRLPWLPALLLGLAAASKYTGLQTIFAACVVLMIGGVLAKRPGKAISAALVSGIVAVAIGAPWLMRNVSNTGNPVYPFFYEKLGGANWDQRRADIYRNEQQSFGVGAEPTSLGHAVLGLAYQPGRYTNPLPKQGQGSPLGAVGAAVICSLMVWLIGGRAGRFEGVVLGAVLLSALMWFALSQQSRYILSWVFPLAVLGGGAVVRLAVGQVLAGVVALQAFVTLYLGSQMRVASGLPVILGSVSEEEYRRRNIPFYEAATWINKELGRDEPAKVALYDEVFGFLLDQPYFWANPGHSTQIPYDEMVWGSDYVKEMKARGFTHVYISLSPVVQDPKFAHKWLGSMGFSGEAQSLTDEEKAEISKDWQRKWQVLLADAVRMGAITPEQMFRNGILFKIN